MTQESILYLIIGALVVVVVVLLMELQERQKMFAEITITGSGIPPLEAI
jgi:hypothetical protein